MCSSDLALLLRLRTRCLSCGFLGRDALLLRLRTGCLSCAFLCRDALNLRLSTSGLSRGFLCRNTISLRFRSSGFCLGFLGYIVGSDVGCDLPVSWIGEQGNAGDIPFLSVRGVYFRSNPPFRPSSAKIVRDEISEFAER